MTNPNIAIQANRLENIASHVQDAQVRRELQSVAAELRAELAPIAVDLSRPQTLEPPTFTFGGCPECGSAKCVARACVLPLGYAMAYRTGKPIFATNGPNLWGTLEGARQASSLNLGAGDPIPVYGGAK